MVSGAFFRYNRVRLIEKPSICLMVDRLLKVFVKALSASIKPNFTIEPNNGKSNNGLAQ